MKTEQLLAGVLAAAEHLDDFDRDWFDRTTAASLKKDTYGTLGEILGVLAVNLRENLREEEAKRAGGGARLRAMKRIAANMEGVKRPWYNGTLSTKDGNRAVCDNFRAVRITDPALPMPAEAAEKPAEPWDLLACYEKPEDLSPAANAPNTAELRAMIREKRGQYHGRPGKKSTFRADYRLEGENGAEVYVNAEYLLDMLEVLPGAAVKVGRRKIVQFYGPDGDGLLCGLRLSEETGKPARAPGSFPLNF